MGFISWSIIAGVVGLIFALYLYVKVLQHPSGTERMKEIAALIQEGAMAYLNRQYRTVLIFISLVFLVLVLVTNIYVALAYLFGGICSMLAGYIGMNAATRSNVRTAAAASEKNQPKALGIAFSGG
ncbi:MAG: sodium/proton-translocating pyrophosphatase, partial [Candidatus Margulisiibacteriota bacterium]